MITQSLREEIRKKHEKVINEPRAYEQRAMLVKESLRSLGDIYSFWIENPDLRMRLLSGNPSEKNLKKKAREGIQAINNAWYFLSRKKGLGRFIDTFSYDDLKGVNGLVLGMSAEKGEFREKDVTLEIAGFTPVSWQRVPSTVGRFLVNLRKVYGADSLEGAIYAHLGLTMIQPFFDGNKRTARIVQNKLLDDAGYPPAIIPAGEGKFYFDLLNRTALAYQKEQLALVDLAKIESGMLEEKYKSLALESLGDSANGQRQFYDFLASKVNNGLDEILGDLDVR